MTTHTELSVFSPAEAEEQLLVNGSVLVRSQDGIWQLSWLDEVMDSRSPGVVGPSSSDVSLTHINTSQHTQSHIGSLLSRTLLYTQYE